MKTANVLTQTQVTALCKGALAAGAKRVVVEVMMPNGSKVKLTASAEDAANGDTAHQAEVNEWDEVIRDGTH